MTLYSLRRPFRSNHFIASFPLFMKQQPRTLDSSNRELQFAAVWRINVRRQDASLPQCSTLVPPNMLMVEPVSTNIHDCNHGDGQFVAGGRDIREQPGYHACVCTREYELVCDC